MATQRTRRLKPVLILCAALLSSGCASMLYSPANADLNDSDASGCDPQALDDAVVKSCRRLADPAPVPSAPPFHDVTRRRAVADPYKLSRPPSLASQFFFELTPLGLFAPLFNYPPRETVYTGRVELSIPGPESTDSIASRFEFRVDGAETFMKTLEFVGYSPDPISIAIRCRPRGCTLSSTPPIMNSDGSIRLERAKSS